MTGRPLSEDVEFRLRAPAGFWKQLPPDTALNQRDARLPVIGTILKRDYRGATLSVIVAYSASSGVTTTQVRTFAYTTNTNVGTQLLSATNPENGTVSYT